MATWKRLIMYVACIASAEEKKMYLCLERFDRQNEQSQIFFLFVMQNVHVIKCVHTAKQTPRTITYNTDREFRNKKSKRV